MQLVPLHYEKDWRNGLEGFGREDEENVGVEVVVVERGALGPREYKILTTAIGEATTGVYFWASVIRQKLDMDEAGGE
jgi:hypothetical protein